MCLKQHLYGLCYLILCMFALFDHLVSSVLGGIKSLQNNERLLGIKSSIESVTMSMRDTLVESWGITNDIDDDDEIYETAYRPNSDQTVVEKDGCGEQQDRNVKEDTVQCQKADSDASSVELNSDEGCPIYSLSFIVKSFKIVEFISRF